MSLTDRLKSLANAAVAITEIATGVAPVISTVPALVNSLKAITADLSNVPNGPDGQPLTIEQAQAHLTLATTKSQAQDDAIRKQAQDELDRLNNEGGKQ